MSVTPELVEHVARLARLRLDPAEVHRLTGELNGILAHMDELADADVDEAVAIGGVADGPARLRSDEPGPDPLAVPVSELAPAWTAGFFTVPRLAALGGAQEGE